MNIGNWVNIRNGEWEEALEQGAWVKRLPCLLLLAIKEERKKKMEDRSIKNE
jgi:hypothetical protein